MASRCATQRSTTPQMQHTMPPLKCARHRTTHDGRHREWCMSHVPVHWECTCATYACVWGFLKSSMACGIRHALPASSCYHGKLPQEAEPGHPIGRRGGRSAPRARATAAAWRWCVTIEVPTTDSMPGMLRCTGPELAHTRAGNGGCACGYSE